MTASHATACLDVLGAVQATWTGNAINNQDVTQTVNYQMTVTRQGCWVVPWRLVDYHGSSHCAVWAVLLCLDSLPTSSRGKTRQACRHEPEQQAQQARTFYFAELGKHVGLWFVLVLHRPSFLEACSSTSCLRMHPLKPQDGASCCDMATSGEGRVEGEQIDDLG